VAEEVQVQKSGIIQRLKKARENTAWILAQLLILYSVFVYAIPSDPSKSTDNSVGAGIFFQPSAESVASFFLPQRTSESPVQAWKVEIRVQALSTLCKGFFESPVRKVIRKILVINSVSFTPCKSILFFPYHEFS